MPKDKVTALEKEIRKYYLKICLRILAVMAIVVAYILVMLWFCTGLLSGWYISDKFNTLYTVTGKCSEVSYSDGRRGSNSHYTFYVDGDEFRINSNEISDYPASDTLENVLTDSEVIIQYVTSSSGSNNIQSLHLSDGTVIADFEYVKKQNTTDFVFFCIVFVLFLLMTLPLICWGCHGWIVSIHNRIPVIKRRLNRMAEREKTFSEQDKE